MDTTKEINSEGIRSKNSLGVDILIASLILALVVFLSIHSAKFNADAEMDNQSYISMAKDLSNYSKVGSIYGQRFLPPLIVNRLKSILGLDIETGFFVLCFLSLAAFLLTAFFFLRSLYIDPILSFTSCVFLAIGAWPIPYNLCNIYQACDAMSYPFMLGIIWGSARRNFWLVLVCGLLGSFCRQHIFLVALLCLIAQFLATREMRWIYGMLFLLVCFGLVVGYVGQGNAKGLTRHTIEQLNRFDSVLKGLYEARLPLLCGPFGLLLTYCWRDTFKHLQNHLWLTLACGIIIVQPLFAYHFTGQSNAQRLAMMGAWPTYLLAAKLMSDLQFRLSTKFLIATLPLLYGTEHLVSLVNTTPCLIGHRTTSNFLLLGIILATPRIKSLT
jgi:hypothetical protein